MFVADIVTIIVLLLVAIFVISRVALKNYTSNIEHKEPISVVMLHGWGASSLIFEHIVIPRMKALGADYKFVALDLLGHGKKCKPRIPKGLKRKDIIAHIVEDVMKDVDKAGIKDFIIVGYSFGATVALHIASEHKERVKALIVNDPILNVRSFELYRRWLFHIFYNLLRPVGETRFILKIINNNWASKMAKRLLPNLFKHTRPVDPDLKNQVDDIKEYDKLNTNPKFWAAGVDALFTHNAEFTAMKVSCPTLIITGDSIEYKAVNTSIKLRQLILAKGRNQVVEIYVVKNSGHHIISVNPNEFCQEVLRFLNEYCN